MTFSLRIVPLPHHSPYGLVSWFPGVRIGLQDGHRNTQLWCGTGAEAW